MNNTRSERMSLGYSRPQESENNPGSSSAFSLWPLDIGPVCLETLKESMGMQNWVSGPPGTPDL